MNKRGFIALIVILIVIVLLLVSAGILYLNFSKEGVQIGAGEVIFNVNYNSSIDVNSSAENTPKNDTEQNLTVTNNQEKEESEDPLLEEIG